MVGYEGLYEVSSLGRVKSLLAGRVMKPWVNGDGYSQVGLRGRGSRKQRLVHRLVCEAFHGPPPEGKPLVLHGFGGLSDNTPSNLRWGSNSDNMRDRVVHGTDPQKNKSRCPKGHPYDKANTYVPPGPRESRKCITCAKERAATNRNTPLERGDPKHGTVYGYSGRSCRCDPCRSAYSDYMKEWYRGKSQAKSG